jgi:hypothetical protein
MDLRKTDIERYSLQADSAWNPGICPDKEGDYVLYTDYLKLQDILNDMVFAYVNKDEDCPHTFEIEALMKASIYLDNPDHIKFANKALERIKSV